MGYYPLMLDVSRCPVVLVGGGRDAEHKLFSLSDAQASLTIFAPKVTSAMLDVIQKHHLVWHPRSVQTKDLHGIRLVFAASEDPDDNRRVAHMARQAGALVNTLDDPEHCDVMATSHFRRGHLLVSVFSGGLAPGVAKTLGKRLEALVSPEWSTLIERVNLLRRQLRAQDTSFAQRRQCLSDFVDQNLPDLFKQTPLAQGQVALVGAGPGAIDGLTIGAFKTLSQAEIVLYDRLVHPSILDAVPNLATRIHVGKTPGVATPTQTDIQEQLVHWARQGYRVVRLHGGDPFLFGRAGEEILALREAGISFQIIPGLTSALAAPALSGIPVTLRNVSDQLAIVTAHRASEKPNWSWLPHFAGTLLILMGMSTLEEVIRDLEANGRSADTPAAIVTWAGWEEQAEIRAPLAQLAAKAREHHMASPAVIIVGDVTAALGPRPAALSDH